MDLNPDLGPRNTGGLSYPDYDLRLHGAESRFVAVTGRKRTLGPNYSATSMTCNS